MKQRSGFTLIELLLFMAIFSIVILSFTTIFVSVLRVYSRQSSAAEVTRQSQLLLQALQYHVERSSLVEMTTDVSTTTIKLRMPDPSSANNDPTYIYLENGTVYLKEGDSGTPQPLTNSRVSVSNVSFIKRSNPPAKDSVDINFSIEYITTNLQHKFAQNLETGVTRVSAATFDSDVVPATSGRALGLGVGAWSSINSTVYFDSSGNVGIGVLDPNAKLQVAGDVYMDVPGSGLIFRAPAGTCWKATANNAGSIVIASTTCP